MRREIEGSVYQLELGEILDLSLFLGEFEPEIHSAVARYCRPGMTVVDIGANFGAHTLLFAGAVGPEGRVIAFEPTAYAYRKLETNVGLNPAAPIQTVNAALTEAARPPNACIFDRAGRRSARGATVRASSHSKRSTAGAPATVWHTST